ncbi:MAG: long-chain fatty acid--CoA ligase [Archangium sp.]|nr:long-chain fatty acid--CoA ligase [Archangium sp.]
MWLVERLASFPAADPALIWSDRVLTYGELLERTRAWKLGELAAGTVVAIEGTFSPNTCSLLLALLERQAVIVPITPGQRMHRAEFEAIAEVERTYVFADDDTFTVENHARPVEHVLTRKLRQRGHAGLVIFSSGSSGAAKAVLHDFEALLEKFRTPRQKKTVLTFLLFDHIGGIDTLMNALSNGGTVVTTPSRDPEVVWSLVAKHRVHTLPTSPTFLNLVLLHEAWKRHDASSLQVIAYGTEPMPQTTLRRLAEVLPHVKCVQTYGLSELGVLRSRSRPDGSLFISFTHDGFETQIRDGVLWVRSPAAMLGYLNAPDLFDAEGWLNTQDAVEVEGEWLRVLGRVSDLINVGGQKVYPAEVEGVLMQLPNVADVAVYGEKNPLTGHFVAARVNLASPEPLDVFKKRLRAFCRDKLAAWKIPVRIELTDEQQFSARFKKTRVKPA